MLCSLTRARTMFKPYLSLYDRLTQIWINQYTLLFIIILIKLKLFTILLLNTFNRSQSYTTMICDSITDLQKQIPIYVTNVGNTYVQKMVNETNKLFLSSLTETITIAENLILFSLEIMLGTYVCVLTASIDSAVYAATNATETVIEFANDTIVEIASDLETGLEKLSSVVNTVLTTLSDLENEITDTDDTTTTTYFTSLNQTITSLSNWKISDDINTALEQLSNDVPDFDDVLTLTESLISIPFDKIQSKINNDSNYQLITTSDLIEIDYTSSSSSSSICSTSDIDKFYHKLHAETKHIFIILMSLLIVVAILTMCVVAYLEFRHWLQMFKISQDPNLPDPIDKLVVFESRFSYRLGEFVTTKLWRPSNANSKNKMNVQWVIAYITSSKAVMLLALGFTGLVIVICQFIMLSYIHNHLSTTTTVIDSTYLDTTMESVLGDWCDQTNEMISTKQDLLNDDLFSWIDETAIVINNTLTNFTTTMDDAIDEAFGDTFMYDYVKDLVSCVLGNKIDKIQEGIEWVYDTAEIEFPQLNQTEIINDVSTESGTGTSSDITDEFAKLISKIYDEYRESVELELYISISFIGLWFLQLLIAILIILYKQYMNPSDDDDNSEDKIHLNYDLKQYNISSPTQLTQSQIINYSNVYHTNVSDPFLKVITEDEVSSLDDAEKNANADIKTFEYGWGQDDTVGDDVIIETDLQSEEEGKSEILSIINYVDDRNLLFNSEQRLSKRWQI